LIEVRHQPEKKKKLAISSNTGDLYEIISGYIKSYKVKDFGITNGQLDYTIIDSLNSRLYKINDFSFHIDNFELDSTSSGNENKIFYTDNIRFSLRNERVRLPDNIHYLSFDSLIISTKESSVAFYNIKLKPNENLDPDDEAFEIWKKIIPEDRIIFGSKKDNFWEMGDVGPCGPCSEIHIDLRADEDVRKIPGKELVNMDHPLVVEVWNLVFIQFNRLSSGELENLPERHVDTGMGFERLVMAIQNKLSNYDTDIFSPLIQKLSQLSGIKYGEGEKTDVAIRVIVDHIRAIAFTIADGQLPSNNKAGYVVRRILRRAVRYGYTFMNFRDPFLFELVPVLADQMKGVFPELEQQKDYLMKVIKEEELSFLRTLENGLKKFDEIKRNLRDSGEEEIPGEMIFELYDTYGFPPDLTALIARENNLKVDTAGFDRAMAEQKSRSKQAALTEKSDWIILKEIDHVEFLGYSEFEGEDEIARYREVSEKKHRYFQVVLDKTPFYAESGGQVGDTGFLIAGDKKYRVFDTKKDNEQIVHYLEKLPEDIEEPVIARIDVRRRLLIQNNHTATHLLHAALRQILGDHVQQRGSLVSEKLLRFDFSHFAKMSEDEIRNVERLVNQKVRENINREVKSNIPIEKARRMGAMALFGEKYGDYVRVVSFDKDYSIELCGGTHVPSTGHIGYFKIITESSIAAGVRRVEAVTAEKAEEFVDRQVKTLIEIQEVLKNPRELKQAVKSLVEDKNKLQKEIEQLHLEQAQQIKGHLKEKLRDIEGAKLLIEKVNLPDSSILKKIAFELKNEIPKIAAVLAADIQGKPQIAVILSESLISEKKLHAGEIIKSLAEEIKGGGGGQPFFATAGGQELAGLSRVLEKAEEIMSSYFAVKQ